MREGGFVKLLEDLEGAGTGLLDFLVEFLERDTRPCNLDGSKEYLGAGAGVAGAQMCSPRSVKETRALQFEHFTDGKSWEILPLP